MNKGIWSLIPAYGVLLAGAHGFGYWNYFDINVFEFMTISQLLMSSIKSIILGGLIAFPTMFIIQRTALYVAIGEIKNNSAKNENAPLSRHEKTGSKVYRLLHTDAAGLIGGGLIAFVIINSFLNDDEYKWAFLVLALCPYLGNWLADLKFLDNYTPHVLIKRTWTYLSIILVALTNGSGVYQAESIDKGRDYLAIDRPSVESERYIGKAGEHLFIFNPNKKSVKYALASKYPSLRLYKCAYTKCKGDEGTGPKPAEQPSN